MQTRQLISFGFSICIAAMLCFITGVAVGQEAELPQEGEQDSQILNWMTDLYDPGLSFEGDTSVVVSEEFSKLFNDEQYRRTIYPATYTWEAAKGFIQQQELKKAFWFFINLYLVNDQNKEVVIKSILTYDKLFNMEKVLTGTFATYSLTDPEIGIIDHDGHTEITAPHIFEKKLQVVKELLFYLEKYKTEEESENK